MSVEWGIITNKFRWVLLNCGIFKLIIEAIIN